MNEEMMIYVYGGKLVKLMRKYEDILIHGFTFTRCSFEWDVTMEYYFEDFVPKNKMDIVDLIIRFLKVYASIYLGEENQYKINVLCDEIEQSKDEIVSTISKIRWKYYATAYGSDSIDFAESFGFDLDCAKETMVKYGDYDSTDDIVDEDLVDWLDVSWNADYIYDKKLGLEKSNFEAGY